MSEIKEKVRAMEPPMQAVEAIHKELIPDYRSDSEEELEVWEPSDHTLDTIDSLALFSDFMVGDGENMRKMKRIEVQLSYKNFDTWLTSEIESIVEEDKEAEDKLFK